MLSGIHVRRYLSFFYDWGLNFSFLLIMYGNKPPIAKEEKKDAHADMPVNIL